jgi:hypothetical protein
MVRYSSTTVQNFLQTSLLTSAHLQTGGILTALTAGVQEHMHKHLGWPGSQVLMEKYSHATCATHGKGQYMLHLVITVQHMLKVMLA